MAPKSRPKHRLGRLSGTESPSSLGRVTASSAIYHPQSENLKISRRNSRPSPVEQSRAGNPAPPSLELARTRALLRARASWPAWPTAGQSVRRIQAPTGEDALWHQTVSEVFSSPGTLLGAQRHARADRITSHSRHTDGRHHTEGDQVLLTHTNADRARGVTRGRQRSLAARL